MKKLFIKTYGCQMNVYDSQRIGDILSPLGYTPCTHAEDADFIVLNTCHIREKAAEKVYSEIGRLKALKQKPDKSSPFIAVTGCVAQAEGQEIIRRAPDVDLVIGPQTYHRLPALIRKLESGIKRIVDTDFPVEDKFDNLPKANHTDGPSAFLTVQEGCDKFCTFCVVPYTRGAEFSRPAQQILDEAKRLCANGVREITLLGQNVNAYHGLDTKGKTLGLGDLINRLAELEGLERLRFTTSHPGDMRDDLYEAFQHQPKLMPYFHLPVQSGSDRILAAMNRRHTRAEYLDVIARLREVRPDIALSGDFIVGFPGEEAQDFAQTLNLVTQVGYVQAYSFKYSPRPGTKAATMAGQVPENVKTERLSMLQELLNAHQLSFNESCVGREMALLVERKGRQAGQLVGRSPYMQSVYIGAPERLLGQIVSVRVHEAGPNALRAHVLTGETPEMQTQVIRAA